MTKKYVRPFTPAWRWFIAASSVGAFVTGWAVLAHAPNPYETTAAAAVPDAPVTQTQPLPSTRQDPFGNRQSRRSRSFQNLPSQGVGVPDDDEDERTVPAQENEPTLPVLPSQNNQQVQPGTPSQLPSTRSGRQFRLRSGGS